MSNENKLGPISGQRSFNLLFIRGEYLVGEVGEERDGQAKVVSVRLNKIMPAKHPFSGTKKHFSHICTEHCSPVTLSYTVCKYNFFLEVLQHEITGIHFTCCLWVMFNK